MTDLEQWGRWEVYAIVGFFLITWLWDFLFW